MNNTHTNNEALYDGYAIAMLFDQSVARLKTRILQSIPGEAYFVHPMASYVPHLTLARELKSHTVLSALKLLPDHTFSVKPKEIALLTGKDGFDLLVIMFESKRLHTLNQTVSMICNQHEHFEFKPHITLACLKKDTSNEVHNMLLHNQDCLACVEQNSWAITGYGLYDPAGALHTLHQFKKWRT